MQSSVNDEFFKGFKSFAFVLLICFSFRLQASTCENFFKWAPGNLQLQIIDTNGLHIYETEPLLTSQQIQQLLQDIELFLKENANNEKLQWAGNISSVPFVIPSKETPFSDEGISIVEVFSDKKLAQEFIEKLDSLETTIAKTNPILANKPKLGSGALKFTYQKQQEFIHRDSSRRADLIIVLNGPNTFFPDYAFSQTEGQILVFGNGLMHAIPESQRGRLIIHFVYRAPLF